MIDHARLRRLAGALFLSFGIAVIAGAATPRSACACSPKQKAYLASMKGDLRIMILAQEEFYGDSGRFAASLSELGAVQYRLSHGVELKSLTPRADGFDARVHHPTGMTQTCWIEVVAGVDGAENLPLAEPQCDPWPSDRFPTPPDWFVVFAAAAYGLLWSLAVVVRVGRAGARLPPLRVRTFVGFIALGIVHPFWFASRGVGSCKGNPIIELLWVIMLAVIVLWMLMRRSRRSAAPLLA